MPEATAFIINPSSNAGKAMPKWNELRKRINLRNPVDTEYVTKSKDDYGHIIHRLLDKGIKRIIIAGGDGSFSEAANVLMTLDEITRRNVALGLIPLGSGNDWARSFGFVKKTEFSRDLALEGRVIFQDVGRIEFLNNANIRHFVNIAGIGFDANTAARVNKIKSLGKGGKLNYAKAIGTEFFASPNVEVEVVTDWYTRRERIFSLAAGICQYNGNGIRQCPNADPFDGEIDIISIPICNKT